MIEEISINYEVDYLFLSLILFFAIGLSFLFYIIRCKIENHSNEEKENNDWEEKYDSGKWDLL